MGRPTISDLAKAAGVSVTTVSHAFSGRRHVDPVTRQRIHDIAASIGYHPSNLAQRLRSGRTGTIALASCVPFAVAAGPSRLGFLMEIAASGAMAAFSRDIALCLIPPQPSADNLQQMGFDGVILIEPDRDDPLVRHFEARRTPIVTIGKIAGRNDIPAVDLHSALTTRMLLTHLRDSGARRIALVTGASQRTSHLETRRTYVEFSAEHQFTPLIALVDEAGGEEGGRSATTELLQSHPEIDGLLVSVDAFATGAVAAASALGRAIPKDLRIATRYDGLRAKLATPPLTAVDLHLSALADLAVTLLLDHIDGRSLTVQAPVPRLVPRGSSVV